MCWRDVYLLFVHQAYRLSIAVRSTESRQTSACHQVAKFVGHSGIKLLAMLASLVYWPRGTGRACLSLRQSRASQRRRRRSVWPRSPREWRSWCVENVGRFDIAEALKVGACHGQQRLVRQQRRGWRHRLEHRQYVESHQSQSSRR